MTLNRLLQDFKGKRVKIGSGMSYFYCDTVSWRTRNEIKDIDAYYLKKYKKFLADNKRKIKNGTLDEKQLENAKKRVAKLKKQIDNYTPLLTREVKKTFGSISYDELDATIIKIEGKELGDFWTIKEYTDYKKDKEEKENGKKEITKLRLYK